MKSKTLLALMLLYVNLMSQNTDSLKLVSFVDEILGIIQKHSIVSDSIQWSSFRKEIGFLVSIYHKDSELFIVERIIKELRLHGDKHSFWRSRKKEKENGQLGDSINYPNLVVLENKIGHLTIPSFGKSNDLEQYLYLDSAIRQIQRVDKEYNIVGWIVDLRKNSGGGMCPMIGCILPLIEEDSLGYFLKRKEKYSWFSIFQKSQLAINKVKKYKCKNLHSKIAVLIDAKTASAAEMTAVSLIGKSNVKLFGENSSGLTTANRKFILSNGSALALSVSYTMDRNGKIYTGKIVPDIVINNDEIINKVKNWIMDK